MVGFANTGLYIIEVLDYRGSTVIIHVYTMKPLCNRHFRTLNIHGLLNRCFPYIQRYVVVLYYK